MKFFSICLKAITIYLRTSLKITIAVLFIKVLTITSVSGCFAVIVGKDASADGSVIFGHLEQNGGLRNMSYLYVPRMEHEPGSVVRLKRGGTFPQAPVTYGYLWGKNTGIEFSDGYFNEWGVAIASDGCPTREDSYDDLVARGDITDGGIGYKLRRIVAQRARSAREGVAIAGELISYFGYASSGRTYIIADADEAWILGVVKGKKWIAQRVPDGEVVLVPNVHIIGTEADLNDTENVVASEGLVEYAIYRGWYDPSSGDPFSFREAFNRKPSEGSFMYRYGADPRQWFSQSLVKGGLIDLPVGGQLPFSVKPAKKMSVMDVLNLMRSHGHIEGQDPDLGLGYKTGLVEGSQSPHIEGSPGSICGGRSQELVIYQLRKWMPTEIGSVAWRTTASPCGSVLVPWYCGITETPEPYFKNWDLSEALSVDFNFAPPKGTFDHDPHNAFDIFTALENMIDLNYSENIITVREEWDKFEQDQFEIQPVIEKVALELFEKDPDLAVRFITDYTGMRALKALEVASKMLNHFKTIHWAN